MLCLLLAGCGKNSGGSSGTTIRGQIVINGQPAKPEQVNHKVWANDKWYLGNVISENGKFVHGNGLLDHEYCRPGSIVTLYFEANEVTGAFRETYVYEYVVKKGDNNLGQIDLGLYGFGLTSPDDDVEIGQDNWPLEFKWTVYGRAGVKPTYRLNLNIPVLFTFVPIEKITEGTSVFINGNEKLTLLGLEFRLNQVQNWTVCVEYQAGDHTIRHYSESRKIKLNPPPTPEE